MTFSNQSINMLCQIRSSLLKLPEVRPLGAKLTWGSGWQGQLTYRGTSLIRNSTHSQDITTLPQTSEDGTFETAKARFWPWSSEEVTSDKKMSRCHLRRVVYHQIYSEY